MKNVSKNYGYNDAFPVNLRSLMENKKTTQATLANICDVQRQTIGQWKDGNTIPDIVSLKRISEYFGVSSDFLIGLTKVQTREAELKSVCEYTGLSQDAVEFVQKMKNNNRIEAVNFILHPYNGEKFFDHIFKILNKIKEIDDIDKKMDEMRKEKPEVFDKVGSALDLDENEIDYFEEWRTLFQKCEEIYSEVELEQFRISKVLQEHINRMNYFYRYEINENT